MIDLDFVGLSEKEKNIWMILDHIAKNETSSTLDIAKNTGLSAATISRGIAVLKQRKLVAEQGKEITDMGRPPGIYSINPKYGYLIHFYLGSEHLTGYLADFSGKKLRQLDTKISRKITPAEFCDALKNSAESLAKSQRISYKSIVCASISIPGMVDEHNSVIKNIPNYSNFNNVDIANLAKQALCFPVILQNEARLCAMGEYILNKKDYQNLIYLDFTSYSGIGAGILVDGRLHSGRNGFAGEIGDMLVDAHSFFNKYQDNEGCLESSSGVGIMLDKLSSLIKKGRAGILKELLSLDHTEEISLQHVEKAVLMQDLDVSDVFDETMKMWAAAAVNLATVLDPDTIILGGVVSTENDVVLARIKHYVSRILSYDVDIRLGTSHLDAQYNGGIHLVKRYALNNIVRLKAD